MRVEYAFDKDLVEASGYKMEDIYGLIKKRFAEKNLPCVSESEILSFSGTGDKNDFSYMWVIMVDISRTEWFLEFATLCKWYGDDGEWEDVLIQAKEKNAKRD